MGSVKIFWKSNCPKCPAATKVGGILEKGGVKVIKYNLDTVDGLAEGAYYSVMTTPTLIVEDEKENPIVDFRGTVPTANEVKKAISRHYQ